jgi:hypothetical protein
LPGWQVSFDGDQCRISRYLPDEARNPGSVDPKVRSCGPDNRSGVAGISGFNGLRLSGGPSINY